MKAWLENLLKTKVDSKPERGDYSVNLHRVLVGKDVLVAVYSNKEFKKYFDDPELTKNGFANFYLSSDFLRQQILKIISEKASYGSGESKKFSINLEFVSANPTGPLTVGNARAASYGDALGNILKKAGYEVAKEYYINDVGVQVRKLADSIKLRMRELGGEKIEFSPDLYQGEYIRSMAKEFMERLIPDEEIKAEAIRVMISGAKETLDHLGVGFDNWFSESELHKDGKVQTVILDLESKGYVLEGDGAKWLKMDEGQKAVLIKSDGSTTYLMNDIAYTKDKFERGFDKAINIWGTDHHGDVPRLKAGVAALGYEALRLEILLHQLVVLKQKDEKLKISKRAGNLVLLEDLINDVGKDGVRFFFLSKDLNTHMEFDIDLAKERSNKNPIYYIQYAHARLSNIFQKLSIDPKIFKIEEENLRPLEKPEELALIRKMAKFPELVEDVANSYQVHRLAQYSYELASDFHNFYEKHHVVQENNKELERARLALCSAVKIVLGQCLSLMGISAPEKM